MHLHEILRNYLAHYGDRPLRIVETGTIRKDSEAGRIGDGWSTTFFAARQKRADAWQDEFTSIDLDISVAATVLERERLTEYATLVAGHSIDHLSRLLTLWAHRVDVLFLDSGNNAELILHEFFIARQLVRGGGLVIIDDVALDLTKPHDNVKGDLVMSLVIERGWPHQLQMREGKDGYRCSVLAIEF